MDYFSLFSTDIIVGFTFLATIRLSFEGILSFPDNKIVNLISSRYWCLFLLIIFFGLVGDFGRNEMSPLPWVAFTKVFFETGIHGAILTLILVVIVDLWLFWTPSQIYKSRINQTNRNIFRDYINEDALSNQKEEVQKTINVLKSISYDYVKSNDKKKIIFARVINVLTGFLLITPHNTFYSLMEYLCIRG
jgi:hypothetical protein